MGWVNIGSFQRRYSEEDILLLLSVFVNRVESGFDLEKILSKVKLKDIRQNDWFGFFKSVKVMRIKERLRSCF